ncbi:MAG: glycine cleavage T C-terminal barrel domain-containing protein, partial [Streptosporangiaceae bacterium]
AAGPRQRLVSVALNDPEIMMWGGELLLRDGAAAGLVTSAAWGATVGTSVGMAYVRRTGGPGGRSPRTGDGDVVTPDYRRSGHYQVNVGGLVCDARVSLRPLYDPDGEKVHR